MDGPNQPAESDSEGISRRLTRSVREGRWLEVGWLLTDSESVPCDEQRRWAIEQATEHSRVFEVCPILSQCRPEDLDFVLDSFVQRRHWGPVTRLLQFPISDSQRRRAVEAAMTHAADCELSTILQHRTDNQVDAALTVAINRHLWPAVFELLQSPVSDDLRRRAVEKAARHASEPELLSIFSHCADDQLEDVLPNTVRLPCVANEFLRLLCSMHAGPGRHTDPLDILLHGAVSTLDLVLTEALEQGLWRVVVLMLVARRVGEGRRRAVLQQVCKYAEEEDVLLALPCCPEDILDSALLQAASRRFWHVLVQLISTHEVNAFKLKWAGHVRIDALVEASKFASESVIMSILPHCSVYELCLMFPEVDRRELWGVVIHLLQHRLTQTTLHCRLIERAYSTHVSHNELSALLSQYDSHQLDFFLTEAVSRNMWRCLNQLLQHKVSDEQYGWAVMEAAKRAPENDLEDILPRCPSDKLRAVLMTIVHRGLWSVVSCMLKRSEIEAWRRWAVDEAAKRSPGDCLARILPYCPDDWLDAVMREIVRRELWGVVSYLLQRPVSEAQRRLAVEEAAKYATENDLLDILPHCADDQLDAVLITIVSRDLWIVAGHMLQRQVSDTRRRWAVEEAAKRSSGESLSSIIPCCSDDQLDAVMRDIVRRGLWGVVGACLRHSQKRRVRESLRKWVMSEACERCHEDELMLLSESIPLEDLLEMISQLWKLKQKALIDKLIQRCRGRCLFDFFRLLGHMYVESLQSDSLCSTLTQTDAEQLLDNALSITQKITLLIIRDPEFPTHDDEMAFRRRMKEINGQWSTAVRTTCERCGRQLTFVQGVFGTLLTEYSCQCNSSLVRCILLPLYAVQDISPVLHKVAHSKLALIFEDVRRILFRSAVEQREWKTATQLTDHNLYDDQRGWGLVQALYDKQWDVMLLLADHGLTDDQLRRVHRQVAKHADWDTVLHMVERGANLTRVKEDLETANECRERPPNEDTVRRYRERCAKLADLESQLTCNEATFLQAVARNNWGTVYQYLRREARDTDTNRAIAEAIQLKEWHVATQLVRIGISYHQRDSLFTVAMRERAWGLGRELLERGVSEDLSRAVLPELVKERQWVLVARVMELALNDTDRRRVMQQVLDEREGSVVAHSISCMDQMLTVDERKHLFEQAMREGTWQAVKRLVEETDDTAAAQRDVTLPVAVSRHRWDIVEHCVHHGANIDMTDSDGNTMLHKAARQADWETTEGLMYQGADQSLVDSDGYSVLQATIKKSVTEDKTSDTDTETTEGWKTVRMLVSFHGDINLPSPEGHTPLNRLLQKNKAEIVNYALLWGRDVVHGTDDDGRTALHVLCQAGLWDSFRFIIGRGGDPLAVTKGGKTVLTFAVENGDCPQKLLAECIRMGISTRQPGITDNLHDELTNASPMYSALRWGELVLMMMLYESGACSNKELHRLHRDPPPELTLFPNSSRILSYLEKIATTPRRLESTCRLVISNHMGISKPRIRDSKGERLLSYLKKIAPIPRRPEPTCRLVISHLKDISKPRIRDYAMFSDLVSPFFGTEFVDDDDSSTSCDDDNVEEYWPDDEYVYLD